MSLAEPDAYSVPRHDVVALAAGLLVFVASFLPWYGVTFEGPAETGLTGTFNAWHGLAGVGLILLLSSMVVTAAEPVFAGEDARKLPLSIVASVMACAGALLVIVKSFSLPDPGVPDAEVGLRWGGWLLMALVAVQALVSVLRVVHARGGRES